MNDIERIVETYSDLLLRLAIHHVKNMAEAQDVVQDVFLKYMKKNPKFDSLDHEKAWFYRVCINRCKDYQRHWWQINRSDVDYEFKSNDEKHYELIEEIKKLNFHERNAIYLFYYEQYTTKQIADIFEVKENTVSSWLHRARLKLKEQLKGEWEYEK